MIEDLDDCEFIVAVTEEGIHASGEVSLPDLLLLREFVTDLINQQYSEQCRNYPDLKIKN